jgi:hypothetical protein
MPILPGNLTHIDRAGCGIRLTHFHRFSTRL